MKTAYTVTPAGLMKEQEWKKHLEHARALIRRYASPKEVAAMEQRRRETEGWGK